MEYMIMIIQENIAKILGFKSKITNIGLNYKGEEEKKKIKQDKWKFKLKDKKELEKDLWRSIWKDRDNSKDKYKEQRGNNYKHKFKGKE